METSVHYSLADKHLSFKLHERVTTKPGLELRGKGLVNTVTGGVDYRVTLQKHTTIGPSFEEGASATPLTLGAGVAMTATSRDRPLLTASARKRFSLLEGPNTVLAVRADLDFDPESNSIGHRACVRVHHKLPNFTAKQDLRLTVGMDMWGNKISEPRPELYLQVRENNWALHYQQRKFRLSYDL